VQLVFMLEHVRQFAEHDTQILFYGTFVAERQGMTQTLPVSRFSVLQDVHLLAKSTHVAQSPAHGNAMPLLLK
jgi:hypothetical protein